MTGHCPGHSKGSQTPSTQNFRFIFNLQLAQDNITGKKKVECKDLLWTISRFNAQSVHPY